MINILEKNEDKKNEGPQTHKKTRETSVSGEKIPQKTPQTIFLTPSRNKVGSDAAVFRGDEFVLKNGPCLEISLKIPRSNDILRIFSHFDFYLFTKRKFHARQTHCFLHTQSSGFAPRSRPLVWGSTMFITPTRPGSTRSGLYELLCGHLNSLGHAQNLDFMLYFFTGVRFNPAYVPDKLIDAFQIPLRKRLALRFCCLFEHPCKVRVKSV